MYKVELWHFYPKYRNGDREEGEELINCEVFKTKKEAKAYVLRKAPTKATQHWHKGDTPSFVYWYTGETWINENSGEKREERYYYKVTKK